MLNVTYRIPRGFLVEPARLAALLSAASGRGRIWTVGEPTVRRSASGRLDHPIVPIRYFFQEKPHILQYFFPLMPAGASGPAVCVHPEAAEMARGGWYPDGGRLKRDSMHDWTRFWGALHEVLDEADPDRAAPDEAAPKDR